MYPFDPVDIESFKNIVEGFGILGPIVVVILLTLSQVLAPFPGSIGVVASAAIYGFNQTRILAYIAGILSAAINFYISKRFGRNLVVRFVGKKALKKIDRLAEHQGIKFLIFARLFGFSIADFISYGVGLTNMKFKPYIIITLICNLFPSFVLSYFFKDFDFSSPVQVLIWMAFIFIIGGIFLYVFQKVYRETDEFEDESTKS